MPLLADLVSALPSPRALAGRPSWQAAGGLNLAGITADSRRVGPGMLFAAVAGSRTDGARFIADAVARGACGVLAASGTAWPPGVPPRPLIEDPEPRRRLAELAAALAGRQPRKTVAVTGTNGKTSTVEFLRQFWATGGARAAAIGTLGLTAPEFPEGAVDATLAGLTTPDPVALATLLAQLARAGVEHAAIEASSHGLDQFRLDGVRLAAAGFSNLTRDHLDYHGSIAAYRQAKLRLFAELLPPGAPAVASTELDAETLAALHALRPVETTGTDGTLIALEAALPAPGGQHLTVRVQGRRQKIFLPLPGRFQADNALLAAGLALALGARDVMPALAALQGVRGRMELAATLPNGAAVYVDYAHTPDALRRLLAALRPHAAASGGAGRLHVVFGAGGDRDPGKRPLMGREAAAGADIVWVTDDNPRGEDPAAIRAAVRAGCPDARDGGERSAAIADAMAALGPGDVLAVAGKGHEQGQTIGGQTFPFDDVSVVRGLAGA